MLPPVVNLPGVSQCRSNLPYFVFSANEEIKPTV